jgi:hypothetical protein
MRNYDDEEFGTEQGDWFELGYPPYEDDSEESVESDIEDILDDVYDDREDYERSTEDGWFYDDDSHDDD